MHPKSSSRNQNRNTNKKRRKKRKKRQNQMDGEEVEEFSSFDRDFFPILLAAAAAARRNQETQQNQQDSAAAVASRLLRRILFQRLPPSPLPSSLLALLPLLLSSSSSSVATLSCEVVGAAALQSMEASHMLASDSGIANGLVRALGSRSQLVAEAACNAMMDLSASPVGRERLGDSPALERLLYLFYQVESISGDLDDKTTDCPRKVSRTNKFSSLIIDTAVIMINSSKDGNLQWLQPKLLKKVLPLFCKIWDKFRGATSSVNSNRWKKYLRNREYELPEAIFRLSMGLAYPAHLEPDDVRISIFGRSESEFENFLLNYWEKSPLLYRRGKLKDLEADDTAFASLLHSFDSGTSDAIIESLLQGLVSCPPIASDELDINSFLHEVRGSLGSPIKYRQDIRVVRTQEPSYGTSNGHGKEEHFFVDGMVSPDRGAFMEKCKDAFHNGFSIALRGMEFRSEKIAAIAVALADLFGQPSVGANVYFSPPRSQGLARHYDDHCVFVWQLFGCKRWMIWPHPKSILPRLYEPFDSLDGLSNDTGGSMQILLEGDILYIPRGYVHQAHTTIDAAESQENAAADYSLHLTLAIEVEQPFEWEGFVHVALHCWTEKQKLAKSKEPSVLFALLLHVAIRLLADHDPMFRKACMVAAKLSSSGSYSKTHLERLRSSQKSTFDQVIKKIDENCSFMEAFRCIESVVKERNDDSLQWMTWLRHLPQYGDTDNRIDFCNLLEFLEEHLAGCRGNIEEAFVEFTQFKLQFCRRVVYEDACESFEMLVEMYKLTRNQYMKGMLSLHRT